MSSTRSKDRELIATTASLVEFLRDVAMARQKRIVDVGDYKLVQWFSGLPGDVVPNLEAGPGETLLTIPRHRPEAPPKPPAKLTGWIEDADLNNSDLKEPPLKEQGAGWVELRQDGSKGVTKGVVKRSDDPGVGSSTAPTRRSEARPKPRSWRWPKRSTPGARPGLPASACAAG